MRWVFDVIQTKRLSVGLDRRNVGTGYSARLLASPRCPAKLQHRYDPCYGPNMRDSDVAGMDDKHGANNPLVSAHPGGVNALRICGVVEFLANEINVELLK